MNGRLKRAALTPGFTVCAVTFALGCAAGVAASGFMPQDAALRERLLSPENAGFLQNLWSAGRFHIAALFFAFSAIGAVAVPGVTAVRGFLLCFTMSGVVRVFGADGVPLALALVLPGAVASVPCLFVIASQSFTSAVSLAVYSGGGTPRLTRPFGGTFVPRVAVCAIALAAAAGAETLWGGGLVTAALSRLTA